MSKKKRSKALDNKCPACGAPIKYSPSLSKWKCEYCNSEFSLEDMKKHNNASSQVNNSDTDTYNDYVTYTCKDCGAEIIADSETAATFCVYCGNTAILKNKLSGKFAPDYVIPFKKERNDAINAFTKVATGKKFVPKDFTNKDNIEKIKGVYIPFWLFDVKVAGNLNFKATKVSTWTTITTYYTKTDYYKLFRTGSMKFNKIPVDGSTRFSNDIMNSIEPFDYNDLLEYNHAYLSGFYAEKYDIDSDNAFIDAKNRALESTKEVISSECRGFTDKTIIENTLDASILKRCYVLLPVWMLNVKYNNKMYLFAMNGQTGEFIGNIPVDKKKVIIFCIKVFLIVFLAIIVISYILYKVG